MYMTRKFELELTFMLFQDDIVKLQILNLATKLTITNSKQTRLLSQYVFSLAKYDMNYDIRDRARFLRQLILPAITGDKAQGAGGALAKHAKKIFLAPKPAPVLQSKFKGGLIKPFSLIMTFL
jgi:AP-3 complex subunit beta